MKPRRVWRRQLGFTVSQNFPSHSYDAEAVGLLKKTFERDVQKGAFVLHQNRPSTEVADRLSALAELAPRFFAEEDYRKSHHQPLQPPR